MDVRTFFDNLAPRWDASEDHDDAEILALLKRIGIEEGDEVLDVACGTGRISALLFGLSAKKVKAVDISSKMIEFAKKKYADRDCADFFVADFLDCDLGEFDDIVLYNAFPHFQDVAALNRALVTHLKDGGRFAIVHSLSREELRSHHSGAVAEVSRDLEEPVLEAKPFAKDFDILIADESDHHFMIVGKKK